MRLFQPLLLSLALLSPAALAEPYQVELILFQQSGDAVFASQSAPDDWAKGAQPPSADSQRPTALDAQVAKLRQNEGFQVLMHKAWRQDIDANPVKIALNEGEKRDGHYPVEGTITLSQQRFVNTQTNFWINQFGNDGLLAASQHMVQEASLKNSVLTYLDHPSLGMLIKVSPLNARPASPPPPGMEDEAPTGPGALQQPAPAAPSDGGFDAPPPAQPAQ
ncbi:CsiV family protein [Pseudomonas sp. ZM23]|uniref:CsiV family protein n=1 Tax=Pseudomonas triclosanedens TaxID=2961893 RepID=A0ABY6ZT27_9PSED|nr:CsiV family protein [Pseudomonas triclosanedens]MCP8466699.1 CsiV family protein [Pseudomonas triclosanedens]MCP8471946.1 CsiV family protein [Pseudomonas triclosanedens]WAI47956.1 CsiV family protein [Pseudomonas triclosanedens]